MGDRYHHGDLHEALLDAGLELIDEHGLKGFSLREVARIAGVSHAAPYRHFSDKDALVAALAERGYRLFNHALSAAAATASAAEGRLQAIGVAYVDFAQQHADYYELLFGDSVSKSSYSEELYELSLTSLRLLEATVAQQVGSDAVHHAALSLWASLHGIVTLYLHGKLPREDAARDLHQLVAAVIGAGLFLP